MFEKLFEQFQEKIASIFFPSIVERRDYFERLANTDLQTQLANRAAFDLARSNAEENSAMRFIVFDCNNFKLVNDALGHDTGDDCLWQIAAEIKLACYKNKARAFRYGGDEFVVIVHWRFAARLRDAIEKRIVKNEEILRINQKLARLTDKTVSISGTVGASFSEADAELQNRKTARKTNASGLFLTINQGAIN